MADIPKTVWLIDDTEHWHAVTAATVQRCTGWSWQGFSTALGGIMAYRHAVGTPSAPTVILCDFFLDAGWRGDVLARELRQIEAQAGAPPAFLVGHSTSTAGSRAIVAAGADVVVAKHGRDVNRSLQEFLQDWQG